MTDEQLISLLKDFREGTLTPQTGSDLWWALQDLCDEVEAQYEPIV